MQLIELRGNYHLFQKCWKSTGQWTHVRHRKSLRASVLENHFHITGFKRGPIRETSDERRDEKFASWSMEGEKNCQMECLLVCRPGTRTTRARIYGQAICIEKSPALIAPFVCLGTLALVCAPPKASLATLPVWRRAGRKKSIWWE